MPITTHQALYGDRICRQARERTDEAIRVLPRKPPTAFGGPVGSRSSVLGRWIRIPPRVARWCVWTDRRCFTTSDQITVGDGGSY